jgi:general secretion pathway protein K
MIHMLVSKPTAFEQSLLRSGRKEGMALVIVLLFIVLMTVIVVEYSYETQVEASFVENFQSDMYAYAAARSAIARGQGLLSDDILNPPEGTEGNFDGLEDAWALGIPLDRLNDGVYQCTISDEYGKIPLNAIFRNADPLELENGGGSSGETTSDDPKESTDSVVETPEPDEILVRALEAFFVERGVEDSPVDRILDWIDSDDESRPNGAESDFYQQMDVPYGCKNGPMDSIEELLMIPGITPDVYWGDPQQDQLPLPELLTVHGHRRGKINVNTAEREVLHALGEGNNQPELEGWYDTIRENGPIMTSDELETNNLNPQRPPAGTPRDPDAPKPRLIVGSSVFRIRGDGASADTSVRIEAYVQRGGQSGGAGTFRMLDWRVIR